MKDPALYKTAEDKCMAAMASLQDLLGDSTPTLVPDHLSSTIETISRLIDEIRTLTNEATPGEGQGSA